MQKFVVHQKAIVWFRRDLRLDDNPALVAALKQSSNVIPVFIWSPEDEWHFKPGKLSRWWLQQSLKSFEDQIKRAGSTLTYRSAQTLKEGLLQLVKETQVEAVYFNHLYDPISLVRDHEIKKALFEINVKVQSYNAELLYEPWEIVNSDGSAFVEFETYWNSVLNKHYQPQMPLDPPILLSKPQLANVVAGDLSSLCIVTEEEKQQTDYLSFVWNPGYMGANYQLTTFLHQALPLFSRNRAKTDRDSTSKLSPFMHYGEISVRRIYYKVREQQMLGTQLGRMACNQSCEDFLRQLGYREYSRYLSFHFPFTHERALLEHLRACPWRMDQAGFKLWQQGLTGYPLVDAGMRSLWSTGWLHNRLRVLVSSFLVKHLLLPWQWGLKHFWDTLLDADLECDALGWQYVAGCMADAHPFDKQLDVVAEAARFDPEGHFVRRWLPQLVRVPKKFIHSPWKAPPHVLKNAGVELGVNYPQPIVSTEESRVYLRKAAAVVYKNLKPRKEPQPFRARSVLPQKQLNLSVDDTEIHKHVAGKDADGVKVDVNEQEVSSKPSVVGSGVTQSDANKAASGCGLSSSCTRYNQVAPKLQHSPGTPDPRPSNTSTKPSPNTTQPPENAATSKPPTLAVSNRNTANTGNTGTAASNSAQEGDWLDGNGKQALQHGGIDLHDTGQVAWRENLESCLSHVGTEDGGNRSIVLNKGRDGVPVGVASDQEWQMVQHAIVKVAESSGFQGELGKEQLKALVNQTVDRVHDVLGKRKRGNPDMEVGGGSRS